MIDSILIQSGYKFSILPTIYTCLITAIWCKLVFSENYEEKSKLAKDISEVIKEVKNISPYSCPYNNNYYDIDLIETIKSDAQDIVNRYPS